MRSERGDRPRGRKPHSAILPAHAVESQVGEHTTLVRILGAPSALDVLRAILANLAPSTGIALDHGVLHVGDRATMHIIETRADAVVEVHGWDLDGVGPLPSGWLVYTKTSCSRGINYDVITVSRGAEVVYAVSNGPDGDLAAQVGDTVVEEVRRRWGPDGERIAAEGDDVTWPSFRDRHLLEMAALLGADAIILRPTVVGPGAIGGSGGDLAQDDDVPF